MKMPKYTQEVAAGLRNMRTTPDAFLFTDETEDAWDNPTIAGIPVYHSAFIINTMTDDDIPFIPLWKKEGDYGLDRGLFNRGYKGE